MKKLLALVLALVMSLSLVTISNAAYTDAADVDLAEAVDVLSAVGVFAGSDGKFSPKANLNREQAAKLIAYLDLGEKTAEALPAVGSFSDVPASSWACKYIDYCADAGIIAGDGAGKFLPSAELNGYAFGKMLLVVLGYDAAIEGFTGASWQINVAKMMNKLDLAKNVDGSAANTLTREQAAQYCLNALKTTIVEYDDKGTSISINGATISSGASKAEPVTSTSSYAGKFGDKVDSDGYYKVQLGEDLYEGDLEIVSGVTSDAFCAPAAQWKYENEEVGTYAEAADATYTNKVTRAKLYDLVGKSVYDKLTATTPSATFTVYVDGTKVESAAVANYIVKNSSTGANGTGNGTTTAVYIDDNDNVTIIIKNEYLLKASANYNASTEKVSVAIPTDAPKVGIVTIPTTLKSEDYAVTDVEKDDYLLYTYGAAGSDAVDKVNTVVKAKVVTGNVDSYANDNVVIDGTTYKYAANATKTTKETDYSIGKSATVVLDSLGFIIYVDEAVESNDDIAYVSDVATSGFETIAKLVFVDGTTKSVTVDEDYKTAATSGKGKFMAYEVNKNGEYELSTYSKADTSSCNIVNKATSYASYTVNSSTVFIIKDSYGDITLYTGVKKVPSVTLKSTAAFVYDNTTDKNLTYVYAEAVKDGIDEVSNTASEYVFILKVNDDAKWKKDADKNYYKEVKALVNGEEQTLNVKLDSDKKCAWSGLVVGNFYKNLKVNSDGYVTGATQLMGYSAEKQDVNTFVDKEDAFSFDDDVITSDAFKAKSAFVATDKVYVVVTGGALLDDAGADYEVTETTCEGLESFVKGYKISGGYAALLNSDNEVTELYVLISTSTESDT